MRAPGGGAVEALPRWAHAPPAPPPAPTADCRPHHHHHPSFPHDDNINSRLAIWQGDISTLDADVITNTTDETLTECNAVSERILYNAGPDLKEEIVTRGYKCRIGEVVVTPGYKLRCRYIIHAVCPKYNPKYHAAAETALHNCYKNVLSAANALGARSLAFCPLAARGYPPELAARAALRAVRRALESCVSPGVVVVGCVRAGDAALLHALAHHYFPRVRIIRNPRQHSNPDDDTSLYDEEAAAAFARACAPDTQRLLAPAPLATPLHHQQLQQDQYERLLRRARTEDLSEVSGIGCLYQSGVDRLGRPVVVFIGKWFPISDIDLDKALLYLIKLLDPIVGGDYVIAYFHTLASSGNHPPFAWLKEVYTVLPYKYKKNLKAFYIVHPTFWTKMMTWWFTTFMAPAIKAKVHSLPGVEFLYSVMARDQLEVPAFVTEYDMTINGLHYFQPDTNNT